MKITHNVIRALLAAVVFVGLSVAPSQAQQLLIKDSEKIDFAHELLGRSMYGMAASQYEEFIVQFPQSTLLEDALLGAAESHLFLKEYDKAIGFYQKYLDQFPNGKNKNLVLARFGQCLYLTGKYDDASTKLTAVNAAGLAAPFAQTLYFYLGETRATQGNVQEAAAHFEKAAQTAGASAYTSQAYLQWGNILARQNDHAGALEKYAKALEAAQTDDMKAAVMAKQGEAYFLSGQYGAAAETFKKIVDGYPSLSYAKDAMVNWFSALFKQKLFDELIGEYSARLKDNLQDPLLAFAHLTAAKALAASGKNDEAITALEKIIAAATVKEPEKDKARVQKAQILVRANRYADAVGFIDGELAAAPGAKAPLTVLKGQSLLGLKDYDKAWAAYQSVSQESPDTPEGAEALCGMAYVRHGQMQEDQAASLFMDCFNKSKDEDLRREALFNAFITYQKINTVPRAIELGELYLKTYPKGDQYSDVVFILAGLYSNGGQYDKAVETLKTVSDDTNPERQQNVHFQTAYNFQLAGKIDDALGVYEKTITDNANRDLVYRALKNSAMIHLGKNDEDKAVGALDRAAREFESNDLSLKTYLWLAGYWQAKNDPQKMLDVLAAGQKNSAFTEAMGIKFFMAEAYRLQNNCPQANPLYDALIVSGDDGTLYKARAHLGKGMCLSSGGEHANAQKELEAAIAQDPDDHFVGMRSRFELARVAETQKDLSQAVKLYLVVAVLYKDPEYAPQALVHACRALQRLNDQQGALDACRQVLDVYPQSSEAPAAKEIIGNLK